MYLLVGSFLHVFVGGFISWDGVGKEEEMSACLQFFVLDSILPFYSTFLQCVQDSTCACFFFLQNLVVDTPLPPKKKINKKVN